VTVEGIAPLRLLEESSLQEIKENVDGLRTPWGK